MPPSRKNAIEQRLDDLGERWNLFAEDPAARLLRWVVDAESLQLVDGWVQLQRDGDGELPDFFLRFDAPFVDPATHGFVLVEALRAEVEATRALLAEEGESLDWSVPPLYLGETDVAALVRCCAAFRERFSANLLKLGVVLAPSVVLDPAGWQQWLLALVTVGVPDEVRILVLDPAEAPLLEGLAAAAPALVVSDTVQLDMAAARAELAAGAVTDDPGSHFRVHFVALTNAAGKGDLGAAHDAAQRALAIAQQHGWMTMQVVVYTALGSAYLGAGHTDHALAAYRAGRQAAHGAEQQGDPSAPKLVVQSWFGEGTTFVSAGRFAEAAAVYEQAAPVAASAGDPLMTLEAWRMAGYCHEQAGDPDAAWRCGHVALQVGEQLDQATRDASTLPFVGQGLLRLAQRWAYAGEADAIRARLVALLGPSWESRAPQPA